MKKYHTLVLMSGGLDSTTCLFKLLSQTNDVISTLYIDVTNNDKKSWCERLAIMLLNERAERYFRGIENHIETKVTINGQANGGLGQPPVWMLHAAYSLSGISRESNLPLRLCVGYTRGDCAANPETFDHIKEMWENLWRMINVGAVPEIYTPLINSTKHNSRNFLKKLERNNSGLKILNTLWVCEDPTTVVSSKFTGYKPCGKCEPCIRSKKLK